MAGYVVLFALCPIVSTLLNLKVLEGLFYDFYKIIETLTDPKDSFTPAFHVVVPSLPGYAWSTLPRKKSFEIDDIARIYNKLMVQTLGYNQYVAQGGDWVR